MDPDNVANKYAVCAKKKQLCNCGNILFIVGHSPLGKNGRFANSIFYFLHAGSYSECNIIITSKEVNLGDGERMQVACLMSISGLKTC